LRRCIYKEAIAVIEYKKINPREINSQIAFYRHSGFPKEYGLGENNILFRVHNDKKLIASMNLWWEILLKYVQRDQLSLMYVLWRNNNNFLLVEEGSRKFNSKYFFATMHKSDSIISKIKNNIKYRMKELFFL
jgi:hypothetical protein